MSTELTWRPKLVVALDLYLKLTFLGSVRKIAADPRFDDLQFVVCNFLAATGHLIETQSAIDGLCAESAGAKHSNPNIRILVISVDETIRQAFNEMRRIGEEDIYPIQFSPGLPEAKAWLQEQPILHDMSSFLIRSTFL